MEIRRRRISEAAGAWIDSSDYATMTDIEQFWHKKITAILLNKKGKWGPYQHALYALRFQDFVLKIVPLSVDPYFTACVVFDRAVVYVGEGFLVDDDKCYQLNVIIRHELAHILLRHQIRMVHKIGELSYSKISMSSSIQELINIIADFEISNKKYTSEDKNIVLHMYLNGKLIKGLVTEMHRESWAKLPLEDMYDKLTEELDRISSDIVAAGGDMSKLNYGSKTRRYLDQRDEKGNPAPDTITLRGSAAINSYADKVKPSVIWAPIEEYFEKSTQFSRFADYYKKLIKTIYEKLKDKEPRELEELFNKLTASKITEPVALTDDFEVTIPEEKFWLNQVLKTLLGAARERPKTTIKRAAHSKDYIEAYNKIIGSCGRRSECSDDELIEILRKATAGGDAE